MEVASLNQRVKLHGPGEQEHALEISFSGNSERVVLAIRYLGGVRQGRPHDLVAVDTFVLELPVTYEGPNEYDQGQVFIGDGLIEIAKGFRGLGLGTLAMRPIICWIQARDAVPVATIQLSGEHAQTEGERDRRNRFYEKLGFVFDYRDEKAWGESRPMLSDKLQIPAVHLAEGWKLEHVEGTDILGINE